MSVNYDKILNVLADRNIIKADLIRVEKISTNAMAQLGRNEDVLIGILV